jgi:hypothetical protein
VILIPFAAGGPDWASIMTAIGTVAVAVAAVWVALWTDRRAARRLKGEHKRSDQLLAEERERSKAEIEEERRIAQEREQLAEAYAVQVALGAVNIAKNSDPGDVVKRLAVMVVNRGKLTITGIEAQFSYDGISLVQGHAAGRVSSFESVPEDLLPALALPPMAGGFAMYEEAAEPGMSRVLTPWDGGIRFESDDVCCRPRCLHMVRQQFLLMKRQRSVSLNPRPAAPGAGAFP